MEPKKLRLKCSTSGVVKFTADGSVEASLFDLTWEVDESAGLTKEQRRQALASFFLKIQQALLGMEEKKPNAAELVRKVGEQQANLINSPTAKGRVRTVEVPHYTVAAANTGPRTVIGILPPMPTPTPKDDDDDDGECDTPLVVE